MFCFLKKVTDDNNGKLETFFPPVCLVRLKKTPEKGGGGVTLEPSRNYKNPMNKFPSLTYRSRKHLNLNISLAVQRKKYTVFLID